MNRCIRQFANACDVSRVRKALSTGAELNSAELASMARIPKSRVESALRLLVRTGEAEAIGDKWRGRGQ